jgi:flagellar biosynthesis GTPase FlhF
MNEEGKSMITRTFEATTLKEAMFKVRNELGTEATVIGTRQIREPRTGRTARHLVTARMEVTDITDEPDVDEPSAGSFLEPPSSDEFTQPIPFPTPEPMVEEHVVIPNPTEAMIQDLQTELVAIRQGFSGLETKSDSWKELENILDKSMKELREELATLSHLVSHEKRSCHESDPLLRQLLNAGVERDIAHTLVGRARKRVAPDQGLAIAKVPNVPLEIAAATATTMPLWNAPNTPNDSTLPGRITALLGPTGHGKTRTAVKLAANASFGHNKRVAIVTTDVRRIGGYETLKAFCQILGIPMRKARDKYELESTLQQLADRDLVIVDTPGYSPWDDSGLQHLQATLDLPGVEQHLVLAAETNSSQAELLARRFGPVGLHSLLVTKVDETRGLGAVLSANWGSGVHLSHICDGQDVPDALHSVDIDDLAARILATIA